MIPQKDLKQIKKLKGRVRGETLKTDIKYVETIQGKKEAEKLKKEMKKIEPDLDYDNIKGTGWYPLRWRILSLVLIKNHFNWGEKEMIEMGQAAPQNSFIVKVILRYFISPQKTLREAPNYWSKHWSTGELEMKELDLKSKRVVYILRDFKGHPVLCNFLKGYFKGIMLLITNNKNITTKETACTYNDDKYHRFELYW